MSFAFMPLYTGDYLRDTQHLSMLEHGAYLKLLMYCWDQKGPAPLDERKLMGICNSRSKEEITAVQSILCEYFVQMDDGWHNIRLTKELQKAEAIGHNRAEAGRLGGLARAAKQLLSKCQASAKHVPVTPTPTPTTTTTTTKDINTLSGKPDDAQEILSYLNKVTGKKFEPVASNMKLIRARLAEYGKDRLISMVAQQVGKWKFDDVMSPYLRPATLFNATKCAQYIAEVSHED